MMSARDRSSRAAAKRHDPALTVRSVEAIAEVAADASDACANPPAPSATARAAASGCIPSSHAFFSRWNSRVSWRAIPLRRHMC